MQRPQVQRQSESEREGAGSPRAYYPPQQMKSYLQDLRTNRPARPTGSRPPPAHFKTWAGRESVRCGGSGGGGDGGDGGSSSGLVVSEGEGDAQPTAKDIRVKVGTQPTVPTPRLHRQGASSASIDQTIESAGKALVQPPRDRDSTASYVRTPSVQNREDVRQEAERRGSSEVGAAMAELDLRAEVQLYESARDEAAEIVWKHRNPNAPENSPNAPYAYPGPGRNALQRPKLQRTRSRSVGPKEDVEQDLQRANSKLRKRHSMGSQTGSRSSSLQEDAVTESRSSDMGNTCVSTTPTKSSFDLKVAKASSDLSNAQQRRRSSGSRRKASGSLFQNPNDQIYEEPEEEVPPAPAPTPMAAEPQKPAPLPLGMRRNPFTRFQSIKGNAMVRSNTDPIVSMKRFDRYEIHRNEPTQSRNAAYTLNTKKSKLAEVTKADAENEPQVKMKDGKEIRSDELRAATGFSLRDRSPKLPTPTMVSDAPGRPIVSFQKDYGVIELKEEKSVLPADPAPEPLCTVAEPRPLAKASTEPNVPTRKSVFERPTSRSGAAPSPFERPTSRSATASPAPLREFSRSSSPAPLSNNRPGTPKGPFANKNPLSRINAPSAAPSTTSATSNNGIPPVPVDPYALPTPSAPNTQSTTAGRGTAQQSTLRAQPPIPSISISETRPAGRGRFSRPQSVSNIPTISVSETPTPDNGRTGSIPSIGVTPPVPTISVSASPAPATAPARGRFNRVSTTQAVPTVSVSNPSSTNRGRGFNAPAEVPSISVNDSPAPRALPAINAPSISVTPSVPSINVSDSPSSTRPLPDPRNYSKKPFGAPSSSNSRPLPNNTRTHWTPTTVRTGAQCTNCALPIAGRIVSAAGCRFHPECFSCYQCGEKLECVAFYPEPSAKHAARVDRIRARAAGQDIEFLPGWDTAEKMRDLEDQDGIDESPRFYCHLDFHECFSPRCKSCKTPIEGEVVVACGAEWHAGHFFCAQCGDPFDSSTPFVEKDGYAWCVNCHTNRYSAKCKGCRKPVTDTVVKALGSEWHMGCFVCVECRGPFDDGRYFLRGESQDPVCVKCEERRLKA